ncbi:ATP-binding protein [Agromyces larvae]|uniref:AAA family ATPase n=1 Tax=Agromyces larvae TaxID=2929802 RepID=A0ABY4C021_9MICO|nr:LuxR family transcriptional regulator [Agromyces larvae]UOE43318.1 AAA family ATPase [Agromyces larvae]
MRTGSALALPSTWTTPGIPPIVARRAELRALRAALDAAIGGDGRAVFVTGEPGGGKSRLLVAIGLEAHARGATVLTGTCIEELGRPLEPFDTAIQQLLRLPVAPGGSADAVAALESAFGPSGDARAIGREQLYDAVVDAVRDAAARNPLVVVLDDLHWAGADAVRLLERLAIGIADAPVLVVAASRSAPPDRSAALVGAVGRVARLAHVSRIALAPFTHDELIEYLGERAGLPPDRAAGPARALRTITGGNPFLVGEAWPRLLAAMETGEPAFEMPETSADLLRPRIAMLDGDALAVLQVAAVSGHTVDPAELLATVEAPREVALRALDDIVRAGLLERHADDSGYAFPHAIARQAVLDLVPPSEAMRLHARIAETLEARFPSAPRLVQRLAHHYDAARALGYGDLAVTYLIRAAESADRRLAHQQSAALLERASAVTSRSDEADRLRARAARSWGLAADFARARALHELNLESADPRTRVRAAIGFEDASWRPGLIGVRAAELLGAALAGIDADVRDPLYIEALASRGRALAFTGDVDGGAADGDLAIRLARAIGDERTLASTLRARIAQPDRIGELRERLDQAEELARLATGVDEDWAGAAGMAGAHTAYVLGDAEHLAAAERRLAESSLRWSAYWRYWHACAGFGRAFSEARFELAAARLAELEAIEADFRSDASSAVSATQTFMLRRETGRLGPALRLLTGDESPAANWAPGLMALYVEAGMLDAARRVLHWLLEHDAPARHVSTDWPGRLALMAEAALGCRDVDAARAIRPLMAEFAGCNLLLGFFVAPFGPADRYLGELDAFTGDADPGAHFVAAIELAERIGASLHLAYSLAASAEWSRATGDRATASKLTARARRLAGERMTRLLAILDAAPEAVESVDAAPEASDDLGDGPLTHRETEVLRLVADGLSNREIARRLVISEHTAANHVRSILMKTGMPNRTSAARYARERGLV